MGVAASAERVASVDNDVAYGLSRGGTKLADALRMAAAAGYRVQQLQPAAEWARHFLAPGAHSLRIGGATALFAAGAEPTIIRTMGRWSSDIYRLYVRACFNQTLDWSRKAGSTLVHDVAQEFDEVDSY